MAGGADPPEEAELSPAAPAALALTPREVSVGERPPKKICHGLGSISSASSERHVWADLTDSLLHLIIALFSSFHDFLGVTSTCRAWRAAVSSSLPIYSLTDPSRHSMSKQVFVMLIGIFGMAIPRTILYLTTNGSFVTPRRQTYPREGSVKVEKLENWALFVGTDRRSQTFSCMNPERWGGKSHCIYVPSKSEDSNEPWIAVELGQSMYGRTHPLSCILPSIDRQLQNFWVLPSLFYGVGQ